MADETKVELSATFPGEGAVIALFRAYEVGRVTMDPEIRKRWDALLLQIAEDSYKVWRKAWVAAGLLEK